MDIDHRRPLIAYLLCALLCAFVIVQSTGTGSPLEPAVPGIASGPEQTTPDAPPWNPLGSRELSPDPVDVRGPSQQHDAGQEPRVDAPRAPALEVVEHVTGIPVLTPTVAPDPSPGGAPDGGGSDGDSVVLAAELIETPQPPATGAGDHGTTDGEPGVPSTPGDDGGAMGGHDGPSLTPGHGAGGPAVPADDDEEALTGEGPRSYEWQDPATAEPAEAPHPSAHGTAHSTAEHPYALQPDARDRGRTSDARNGSGANAGSKDAAKGSKAADAAKGPKAAAAPTGDARSKGRKTTGKQSGGTSSADEKPTGKSGNKDGKGKQPKASEKE